MKLNEVVVQANSQLTNMQKSVLLQVYMAQSISTQAAAESMKGNDKAIAAGEFLLTQAYVVLKNGGVSITKKGTMELVNQGLIANGQPTDIARHLINQD